MNILCSFVKNKIKEKQQSVLKRYFVVFCYKLKISFARLAAPWDALRRGSII